MTAPAGSLEERIAAAAREVSGGETSLGDALRSFFPEAISGDEDPGDAARYAAACEDVIRAWCGWNIPAGQSE